MAKINDEYDIGAAFEAIENELISSMIRNFENHKPVSYTHLQKVMISEDSEIKGQMNINDFI